VLSKYFWLFTESGPRKFNHCFIEYHSFSKPNFKYDVRNWFIFFLLANILEDRSELSTTYIKDPLTEYQAVFYPRGINYLIARSSGLCVEQYRCFRCCARSTAEKFMCRAFLSIILLGQVYGEFLKTSSI
jgi:hypothetical protein